MLWQKMRGIQKTAPTCRNLKIEKEIKSTRNTSGLPTGKITFRTTYKKSKQ